MKFEGVYELYLDLDEERVGAVVPCKEEDCAAQEYLWQTQLVS